MVRLQEAVTLGIHYTYGVLPWGRLCDQLPSDSFCGSIKCAGLLFSLTITNCGIKLLQQLYCKWVACSVDTAIVEHLN